MKKFINELLHKYVLRHFNRVKGLHDKIKQINYDSIEKSEFRNPYQAFLDWILETLTYGLIITIVISSITNISILKFLVLTLVTGLARWLWLDLIKETSNAIRGK